MTEQTVIDLGLHAIWIACLISAPALLAILITGLIVSVLQAGTDVSVYPKNHRDDHSTRSNGSVDTRDIHSLYDRNI